MSTNKQTNKQTSKQLVESKTTCRDSFARSCEYKNSEIDIIKKDVGWIEQLSTYYPVFNKKNPCCIGAMASQSSLCVANMCWSGTMLMQLFMLLNLEHAKICVAWSSKAMYFWPSWGEVSQHTGRIGMRGASSQSSNSICLLCYLVHSRSHGSCKKSCMAPDRDTFAFETRGSRYSFPTRRLHKSRDVQMIVMFL